MRNLSVIKGLYQGNGVTRRWAIPFEYNDKSQIFVTITTFDEGDYTYRVLDSTEYTIDEDSVEIVYPKTDDDAPIPSTQYLTVWRDTDLLQLMDLTNQGAAWPDSIEASLDKLHQIVQELAEGLSRSLKVDIGDPQTPDEKLVAIQDYVLAAAESSRSASSSAVSANQAAESAATSAANAAESERLAGGYADTATAAAGRAEDSAISARAYNAPDYDNTKTYQAGNVVTFTDGNSYRALQETTGNEPPNIIYWQKVTDYVGDDFFEIDEYGYIVPMDSPSHSRYWRVDQNGYIVPIEGGDGGYRPDTRSLSAEYLNVTNEGYIKHLRADDISAQEVDADEVTAEVAAFNTLTANAVNAGTVTANDIIAKGPWADARAFGITSDGNIDQTALIQAVIDYCATKKTVLYFPAGTYYVTGINLSNNYSYIRGAGEKLTIIRAYGTIDTSLDGLVQVTTAQAHIEHLTIDVANSSNVRQAVSGLYIERTNTAYVGNDVQINNVTVMHSAVDNIRTNNKATAFCSFLTSHDCGGVGINWDGNDSKFFRPTVYMTGKAGVYLKSSNFMIQPRIFRTCENATAVDGDFVDVDGAKNIFSLVLRSLNFIIGGAVEECCANGIYFEKENNRVDGDINAIGDRINANTDGHFNTCALAFGKEAIGNTVNVNIQQQMGDVASDVKYLVYFDNDNGATAYDNNVSITYPQYDFTNKNDRAKAYQGMKPHFTNAILINGETLVYNKMYVSMYGLNTNKWVRSSFNLTVSENNDRIFANSINGTFSSLSSNDGILTTSVDLSYILPTFYTDITNFDDVQVAAKLYKNLPLPFVTRLVGYLKETVPSGYTAIVGDKIIIFDTNQNTNGYVTLSGSFAQLITLYKNNITAVTAQGGDLKLSVGYVVAVNDTVTSAFDSVNFINAIKEMAVSFVKVYAVNDVLPDGTWKYFVTSSGTGQSKYPTKAKEVMFSVTVSGTTYQTVIGDPTKAGYYNIGSTYRIYINGSGTYVGQDASATYTVYYR